MENATGFRVSGGRRDARIAIVNRGDAAMRLVRAVREYNLEHGARLTTIALFTDEERSATFVREADESLSLGSAMVSGAAGARQLAYVDHDRLADVLTTARADFAWVGWGFVSEQPDFAELCDRLAITMIGPTASTMRLLGDKIAAKRLAESSAVPVVPWSGDALADLVAARDAAEAIGYPFLVKAAAGGGGRGIRRVATPADLDEAVVAAKREALSAFGDESVFLERTIERARHVEVQVAADAEGNVWTLGVRDCSVQRRRQKIVEESGVPGVDPSVVTEIRAAASRLVEAAAYRGLGTVEFLLDETTGAFYFMEVNTRLQVEHTVTEAVTGVDLVKLQLELAFGRTLEGAPPPATGYAIEARVTAEDPLDGFRPAPGDIVVWEPALGPGLRMDTGISVGDPTPPEYDPLLVKVIAHGRDRAEALARLRRGVAETRLVVRGGSTTLGFLRSLLAEPTLQHGGASTDWVDALVADGAPLTTDRSDVALLLVAISLADRQRAAWVRHLFATAAGGRPELRSVVPYEVELTYRGSSHRLAVRHVAVDRYDVTTDDGVVPVTFEHRTPHELVVTCGSVRAAASILLSVEHTQVTIDGVTYHVRHGGGGVVASPLPAIVLRVDVSVGETVAAGDTLAVLESMKLETPVVATAPGVVREILAAANTQVASGDVLLRIEESRTETPAATPGAGFGALVSLSSSADDEVTTARRRILGFDSRAVHPRTASHDVGRRGADVSIEAEFTLLRLFTDCCTVSTEQRLRVDSGPIDLRGRDAMARLLAMPERREEILPAAYLERVTATLSSYGVESMDGPGAREALYRLVRGSAALDEIEPVVVEVLHRWVGRSSFLREHDPSGTRELLEAVAVDCEDSFPVVSDVAWSALRAMSRDRGQAPEQETGSEARAWTSSSVRSVLAGRGYRLEDDIGLERHEVSGSVVWTRSDHASRAPAVVIGVPASWSAVAAWLRDHAPLSRVEVVGDEWSRDLDLDELCTRLTSAFEELVPAGVTRVTVSRSTPGGEATCYASVHEDAEGHVTPATSMVHPETADRLEFWRFARFRTRELSSSGDVHLLHLTADENPDDQRLVSVAGVHAVPGPSESDAAAALRRVEETLLEAFAQIREHQATVAVAERSQLNRVVLYVERPWTVTGDALPELSRRLAPMAKNLGIDRVIARVQVLTAGGALEGRVLHLTTPVEFGLMAGESDVSEEPLRPMSPRRQKLVRLHRRGLYDPYEITDLMTARTASVSDLPPGTFAEFDLDDAGSLVPVDRPHGQNTAGIVVGTLTNVTEKHPEGMTRVVLLSDPARGLGALSEAECRRICAALDLAADRGIPVEWFAVSSGARVAMSSGTENLDWTARVLRAIVEFTQAGNEINTLLVGVNVGAQSYFNAEATMLMHTKGILVMTPQSSMVLTGKDALDFAGGVSAENNLGIGGYDRIMGPNGQAQYWAPDLPAACQILFRHYEHTYVAPGESGPRTRRTTDPRERDISAHPHPPIEGVGFTTVGEIFSDTHNPARNRPFDIRAVMHAVIDDDSAPLERWKGMAGSEGAVVWDAHLGGMPACVIGIESRPLVRAGRVPSDGPGFWSAATLFPGSSKKLARALNSASGNRPVVVLANLAGFDGSPESLRQAQLEYGAEIGRAVTNFRGPILFCVVSRYHGGAFVVFSKALNDSMEVIALKGARASVIGGSAAAAVVFAREVERRVAADPRVATARGRGAEHQSRAETSDHGDRVVQDVRAEIRATIAAEFDRVHSVDRALRVGSVDRVIEASALRAELVGSLERILVATPDGPLRRSSA